MGFHTLLRGTEVVAAVVLAPQPLVDRKTRDWKLQNLGLKNNLRRDEI
jgi:hypothetical protein